MQVGDQVLVTDPKAQSSPRQGAGLGEGLGDQEVIVLVRKRHGALGAEIHVGLVDDHHAVRVGSHDGLDLTEGQAEPRGGVGVGDHDSLAVTVKVIAKVHREVGLQGDLLVGDTVELGEYGVEAVGDGGEHQGVILVGKGHEGKVQNLVRAVGEDDLLGGYPVEGGQLIGQLSAGGVGVELEPSRLGLGRLDHGGGGREGRLVGVELDILHIPGLLPGGVGGQLFQSFGQKAAHDQASSEGSSKRTVALLAWAERPSRSAK